jgi:hypothetical protein
MDLPKPDVRGVSSLPEGNTLELTIGIIKVMFDPRHWNALWPQKAHVSPA